MSSLDRRLGLLAIAEGIPALKECPEIRPAFVPKCFCRRIRIVLENLSVVKNDPLSNVKTGRFYSTKIFFDFFRFQRHEKGQKFSPSILKMSMKSPDGNFLIFGKPICMVT
jgi:hypothetical protein